MTSALLTHHPLARFLESTPVVDSDAPDIAAFVDARGNRPGVDARFSLTDEALAFPIRPEFGELDYLRNEPDAHPLIVASLTAHDDALALMAGALPSELPLP